MNIITYFYQTSDFNLFMLLSSFFILVSLFALFAIKKFIPLHLRYQENAVIACTSALVAVIYGILSGLAAMYLINNYNSAIDATQREANSITNLYIQSNWLKQPTKNQIQTDIKKYLNEVINSEWPLMNQGQQIGDVGDYILKHLSDELSQYQPTTQSDVLMMSEILSTFKNLYDARQQRIQMSYISLNNEVWVAIIIGTILILFISYLFGVNFYLHIFIVVATALMVTSTIFLLISLDKPFQGAYLVGPEELKWVSTFVNKLG